MTFLREALLVAGKDLRIERRSRVALQQILPFGGIVVVMFAFALDADRTSLPAAAPGLFWAAVLLAALLAIGRSFAVEEANGARDGLRLSGLDGGAIFVGKAAAIAVELFLLEVVLGAAVVALYGVTVTAAWSSLCAAVAATVGLAATGTVYGVLATGLRARDTLVPFSSCPAVTPVMLGGSRAFAAALDGRAPATRGRGCSCSSRSRCSRSRRAPWRSARCWRSREHAKRLFVRRDVGRRARDHGACSRCGSRRPTRSRATSCGCSTSTCRRSGSRSSRSASPRSRRCCGSFPRTCAPTWDLLAGASAEVGVVFTGTHADRRLALGPADVGHVVGVGRAAHDHRDPLLLVPRLPRVAAHGRDLRRARQALRDRRADRVRRRADRAPLGHVVADAAPVGHGVQQPSSNVQIDGIDGVHARLARWSRSRCSTSTS